MDFIYVKMLDAPAVFKNYEIVAFPFKKAEALFYYMILKKQATRDEVCSLLWPDNDEESAKKNLRDSIYKIKKAFDMDIIISPQKSILMINPNINLVKDIDDIENKKKVDTYGEFLRGFSLKDSENFDNWVLANREYFKEAQQKNIYDELKNHLNDENYDLAEKFAKILISIDELDEKAYRILMKIYSAKGMYNKAIELYNKLSFVLEKELGITPELKTKTVLDRILDIREKGKEVKQIKKDIFYGREKQLKELKKIYMEFLKSKISKAAAITGEAGIGKTRLKDEFVKGINEGVLLIQTNCYQAEENYFLKPWNTVMYALWEFIKKSDIEINESIIKSASYMFPNLFDELGSNETIDNFNNMKYGRSEEAVFKIIEAISKNRKIIIVFEDIQWADSMSINLIEDFLLKSVENIMIVMTIRDGYGRRVDKFLTLMSRYEKLYKIEIKRFDLEQTEDFIKTALPDYNLTDDIRRRIFKETEGNTFFIVEFISSILRNKEIDFKSERIVDLIKSRFIDLSDNAMKILGIISMFFDEAPFSIIKEISGKDDMEIMDIIEEIQERNIISEQAYSFDICYKFTHQKLREYIYTNLSQARRIILHGRIAKFLEKDLRGDNRDIHLYSKLIYHYINSGNRISALKYSIKNVNAYLDFNHELFPVLNNFKNDDNQINSFDAIKQITDIEKLIEEIKEEGKDKEKEEVKKYEAMLLHIKGRYLIREGEYDKGVFYIKKMIEIAEAVSDKDLILKGYKQIIFYCIQTYNENMMEEYVESALKISKDTNNLYETGSLLRLKGLNRVMMKDFERAEELLKESIDIFNILNQRQCIYSLNIAAAYNYIGEIRRKNMRFSSALEYYDRAISISGKNSNGAAAVFYGNAGQAAFEMGDYERAKSYFKNALELYEISGSLWGRAIAEGFMALLLTKEGRYSDSKEHLKKADKYAEKLKSPHEIGIVFRIKAEIKHNMKNNDKIYNAFSDYLTEEILLYCQKGTEFLSMAKENYEIEILEVFKKAYIKQPQS
ncbi:Predicted ATPase [Caloramator quimbayensis]|uniref:Predicted ATPase n=1 Tax=Caloramator quimbayensis TaxID=1147123 RepID=A0A1T4Y2E8_9CLOT|nr:tetratricopeptide repeat protein [Caloramator quimbayensis]SKA95658.1 Predicted ATPase [Caloramator quimbayensis]